MKSKCSRVPQAERNWSCPSAASHDFPIRPLPPALRFARAEGTRRERLIMSFRAMIREVGDVTVIDMDGRITLGEGSALLRDLIAQSLSTGHRKILMNLGGINYIDSTGLGELVSGYRQVKDEGGELKLLNLNKKVTDLL